MVTFHIHNVNDVKINLTDIEEINIQTGDTYVLELLKESQMLIILMRIWVVVRMEPWGGSVESDIR